MQLFVISECSSCGASIAPTGDPDDMDATHCEACNDRFYAAMRAEYPYGQCWQCGARGYQWLCPKGKQHIVFNHAEGACSMWSDRADLPQYAGCDVCPPEILTRPILTDDPEDLPF